MSLVDQEKFFDVLEAWHQMVPGEPADARRKVGIRASFNSKTNFKNALSDDVDDPIQNEGWIDCTLEKGGDNFHFIFRPVLEMA